MRQKAKKKKSEAKDGKKHKEEANRKENRKNKEKKREKTKKRREKEEAWVETPLGVVYVRQTKKSVSFGQTDSRFRAKFAEARDL